MQDFKLRDYQISALNTIHNDLQIMNNVLLVAMMRSGKTVISCRLINRYYFETPRRFLILCHKQELVEQFHKTFQKKTDIPLDDIGISCAALKQNDISKRITIGTVQTFVNQIYDYQGCDLLIVDECHRIEINTGSQYDQVINFLQSQNDKLRILGITASPFRLDTGFIYGNKNNKDVLFEKINHQITYKELKEQGFLMPLHGEIAINDLYEENMKSVDISGDYNLEQISDIMTRTVHLETAVQGIKEHCQEYKHIVIFCCTIEHAEMLKDLLNNSGENCTTIHSKLTPIERDINMKAWKSGQIRIMTSINILVEGFDFPPLDCLVFARPTLSAMLYLQAVGRPLTYSPETGKTKAFLLDLTDNTSRFGTDIDNIKIKIPYSVQKKIDDELEKNNEKQCPECGEIVHKALVQCLECGYTWEIITQSAQMPDTESVTFETEPPPPPEIYDVEFIEFHRHQKKGKPDSVRVEYHNAGIVSSRICSEWLCFDHGGYATEKAYQWWDKMTTTLIKPENTDHALDMIFDVIIKPKRILVGTDGQYQRVLEHYFNDDNIDPDNYVHDDDIPF